jgi:hypothetical protein
MIRVVLDTNIVISGLLQPQGLPARTFLIALAGTTAQLCVSGDVYAEYEEVIRRPKFSGSEAIIDHALLAIRESGFLLSGKSLPKRLIPQLVHRQFADRFANYPKAAALFPTLAWLP